jgi:hypothetical protein
MEKQKIDKKEFYPPNYHLVNSLTIVEFIITYGWILLIILSIVIVIFSMYHYIK